MRLISLKDALLENYLNHIVNCGYPLHTTNMGFAWWSRAARKLEGPVEKHKSALGFMLAASITKIMLERKGPEKSPAVE